MATSTTDTPALLGGTPVRGPGHAWPAWPVTDAASREALLRVFDSGAWWYGEEVRAFEREYAAFQGTAHCVTVNSGTAAAEVLLQALGIGPGDEVIVPPYTFMATATAVLRVGATPVFADVDATWCLDPEAAAACITPRTRALHPVHFGGVMADLPRLQALADAHGLRLIEDAAHAWGSAWDEQGAGTCDAGGVFSFQHSKNLTAGEGGAITTDDGELAERCRSITHSGRVFPGPGPHHYFGPLGTNARLTELQAALLRVQLARLPEETARRAANAARLDAALAQLPGLTPQPIDPRQTRRAVHLYCLRLDTEAFGCDRDTLLRAAAAEGLPLKPGYPTPVYAQPVFQEADRRDYTGVHCPVAEDLCANSAVWIPHTVLLAPPEEMGDVVAILTKLHAHAHALTRAEA